ncbi:hypothetical protein RDWZM_001636 [Blomia tropicalis]|uniref:ethanolamine kinase n=1 Tax=Blomia tropicalis TaxID=40697 RepID=A0A9Q0RRH3_BLOTA|nr:Ethanolamine kinase [Blomia tropicalis]KAJ6223091.1 hypothetical protein RDWZM_001636 [Blomia tropicalis]
MSIEKKVPNLDLTISLDCLYDGARLVVQYLRPNWKNLQFKLLTDGITNRLVQVWECEQNESEKILIRVYGVNTDLFIDRQAEMRNMQYMNEAGLAAPLYCSFNNGIAYGFTTGLVLDQDLVQEPKISKMIAQQMAIMHSLKPKCEDEPKPCLFGDLHRFLSLIPKDKSRNLNQEVDFMETVLPNIKSPVVFCHNDLLMKNIIYNKSDEKISFIDFEYSNYNYQAFDIANHFCEFGGVDSYDSNKFPNKQFQIKWIESYIEMYWQQSSNTNCDVPKDVQVINLYEQVEKFTLAAFLYWGIWALVQDINSSIEFDYMRFADERLNEYFKRKQILFN